MGHGQLSSLQEAALRKHVTGKVVHDLGAGDLELSHRLIALGAERVVAVDKIFICKPWDSRVQIVQDYFHCFHDAPEVAFLSWPPNWPDHGLNLIVWRAPTVIYLGKNTDGISCGGPALFRDLVEREVLDYSPHPTNTLIIYGEAKFGHQPRPLRGEEKGAIHQERIWDYEEVENV